jgi:hypothetical protein
MKAMNKMTLKGMASILRPFALWPMQRCSNSNTDQRKIIGTIKGYQPIPFGVKNGVHPALNDHTGANGAIPSDRTSAHKKQAEKVLLNSH